MLSHGETMFDDAQQARAVLTRYGFTPLVRLGSAEHWVRGPRRCILVYAGDVASNVPLDGAVYVWFVAGHGTIAASFD